MLTSRWLGGTPTTSLPYRRICPSVGSSKPPIMRSVVVFPQPDGPSRETNSTAPGMEPLCNADQFDCLDRPGLGRVRLSARCRLVVRVGSRGLRLRHIHWALVPPAESRWGLRVACLDVVPANCVVFITSYYGFAWQSRPCLGKIAVWL